MICKRCSQKVEISWDYCPHCGAEITKPTPEKAREQVKALQNLHDHMTSPLDVSPEGISRTRQYVDEILIDLDKILNTILAQFFEHQEIAQNNPRMYRDDKWIEKAKFFLHWLTTYIYGDEPNLNDALGSPPGCHRVGFELTKIAFAAESLKENYIGFIDGIDRNGLEKAGESISEIHSRIVNAYNELENVVNQSGEAMVRNPTPIEDRMNIFKKWALEVIVNSMDQGLREKVLIRSRLSPVHKWLIYENAPEPPVTEMMLEAFQTALMATLMGAKISGSEEDIHTRVLVRFQEVCGWYEVDLNQIL